MFNLKLIEHHHIKHRHVYLRKKEIHNALLNQELNTWLFPPRLAR